MGFLKKLPALRQSASPSGGHFGKAGFAGFASPLRKRSLQIRVAHGGRTAGGEPIVHAGDNIATTINRVESAAAVAKAALCHWKLDKAAFLKVEGPHPLNRRGDFLTVSAHILHRRPAHRAGDAGQALDARAVVVDCALDEAVPVFACRNLINPLLCLAGLARSICRSDAAQAHPQDQPVKSGVGDQQVAAPAQHKELRLALLCPGCCLCDLIFTGNLDKPARRPADREGGEGRQQLVFFDEHRIKATPLDSG